MAFPVTELLRKDCGNISGEGAASNATAVWAAENGMYLNESSKGRAIRHFYNLHSNFRRCITDKDTSEMDAGK